MCVDAKSFCVQFGNQSQHAVGLYDNKVMRASRNFPLSSIFSSITVERDMDLHITCCGMVINVHVCVFWGLAELKASGTKVTETMGKLCVNQLDRSVSVVQLISKNC